MKFIFRVIAWAVVGGFALIACSPTVTVPNNESVNVASLDDVNRAQANDSVLADGVARPQFLNAFANW